MPPFFFSKRITGNSKWQFLHVIELEKTKRVCPIFILVLVRKCVGKVISLTHLPFLHPYCCGNSLYQLLPMRFPSID